MFPNSSAIIRFYVMARFRRFRRSYGAKTKRNAERIVRGGSSNVNYATQQTAYTYTATQACTAKSIKLDIGQVSATAEMHVPYALVVVREGYDANQLNYPAVTDDMYNPTMDVLISGILTDNSVEDHKFNMVGRKLKRGDRLCLIVYAAGAGGTGNVWVHFEMNFTVLT